MREEAEEKTEFLLLLVDEEEEEEEGLPIVELASYVTDQAATLWSLNKEWKKEKQYYDSMKMTMTFSNFNHWLPYLFFFHVICRPMMSSWYPTTKRVNI